jgi:hypothetical protein
LVFQRTEAATAVVAEGAPAVVAGDEGQDRSFSFGATIASGNAHAGYQ